MLSRSDLTAGVVEFTVTPSDTFVVAMSQLGYEWHACYSYRINRKEDARGVSYFLSHLSGKGKKARWVYVGIVHPSLGTVRLTTNSAFPATATRVRVAQRVLTRLFAGEGMRVEEAGWSVDGRVVAECTNRF